MPAIPPDDDPTFLARMKALREAPKGGDVVNRASRARGDDDELDEGPLEQDIERFSGVTRSCPSCSKDVFDDSAVCYHCGHAFERTAAGSGTLPRWVIATIVVVLAAFLLALALRLF